MSRWASQAIEESQRRLAALGVFRRVTISELQHESDDRRDVLVTVEESPATTIGYGGGVEFQKVENVEFAPRGFFEIGRRNLWGKNRVDQPVQPRQPPAPHRTPRVDADGEQADQTRPRPRSSTA